MHKLLTAEIQKRMPGPRAQENAEDPIVYAKFFSCRNGWTWYAYEGWQIVEKADGDVDERALSVPLAEGEKLIDIHFFGLVVGQDSELGPWSLNEHLALNEKVAPRGRGLLFVERDIHFKPTPLSVCKRTAA